MIISKHAPRKGLLPIIVSEVDFQGEKLHYKIRSLTEHQEQMYLAALSELPQDEIRKVREAQQKDEEYIPSIPEKLAKKLITLEYQVLSENLIELPAERDDSGQLLPLPEDMYEYVVQMHPDIRRELWADIQFNKDKLVEKKTPSVLK